MGAHMRRALEDRLLQCAARTGVNVLRCERGLGLRRLTDRFLKITAIGSTSVKDTRLVEMDVRLDEAGRDEPAVDVDRLAFHIELRSARRDLSGHDPDVGKPSIAAADSRVLQDEIHGHLDFSHRQASDDVMIDKVSRVNGLAKAIIANCTKGDSLVVFDVIHLFSTSEKEPGSRPNGYKRLTKPWSLPKDMPYRAGLKRSATLGTDLRKY